MLKGIDVSKWQSTTPNLTGYSFLFARATIGATVDPKYAMHIANARKAGLLVGAYHFNWNTIPIEVQVNLFLKTAGNVDFLALDVEGLMGFTKTQARRFIYLAKLQGKDVGLYHSASGFYNVGQKFDWVAKWSAGQPSIDWEFWQYTSSPVDKNYFDGDLAALKRLSNNWKPPVPVPTPTPTPTPVPIPTPQPPQGENMNSFSIPRHPSICDIPAGKTIYTSDALDPKDKNRIIIGPKARTMPYYGVPRPGVRMVEYVNSAGVHSGLTYFVSVGDVTNVRVVPPPAPVPTPPPANCADAVTKAVANTKAKAYVAYKP